MGKGEQHLESKRKEHTVRVACWMGAASVCVCVCVCDTTGLDTHMKFGMRNAEYGMEWRKDSAPNGVKEHGGESEKWEILLMMTMLKRLFVLAVLWCACTSLVVGEHPLDLSDTFWGESADIDDDDSFVDAISFLLEDNEEGVQDGEEMEGTALLHSLV